MFKYLLVLLAVISMTANAGYKGKDPVEMAKTADVFGTAYHLYSLDLNDAFALTEPVCYGRNQMLVTTYDAHIGMGCWWKVGKQVFGYSQLTGVTQFNMDLLLVNDNFTGEYPKGF